jgi:hypothetical protein
MNIFKTSNQVVQEIHNEVDSAQERLLQQAQSILKKNTIKSDIGERLNQIGFSSSPMAKEYKKINSIIVETKEQAELIEYYKFNYPFLKFLTIEEFDRICKKYSLIYASTECYIKDVPEKNIKDIESCQELKSGDMAIDLEYCILRPHTLGYGGSFATSMDFRKRKAPKRINGQHFDWGGDADSYMKRTYGFKQRWIVSSVSNCTENRQGLFIAAPKSHFDLRGKQKSGLGFFDVSIVEIKDPIVFRYVRGGIQVITKWGLEGKDEGLFVDKMN